MLHLRPRHPIKQDKTKGSVLCVVVLGTDRLTTGLRSASAWAVALATSAAALSTCLARTKGPFLRCFVAARPLIRSDQINSHCAYAAKLTNHSGARLHPKHACTAALNLPMGVSGTSRFPSRPVIQDAGQAQRGIRSTCGYAASFAQECVEGSSASR